MIAHYGWFEDASAVNDVCPLCSVPLAASLSFEFDHLFSGQSVLWDQRVTVCSLFLIPLLFLLRKIAVIHRPEPKSTTIHLSYCIPRNLA